MVDAAFPVGFRMSIGKMVVVAVVLFCQDASSHNRLAVNSVHTGHIQGYWVKRCKHTNVWNDRYVIFRMAVAVRRNVNDQADMEVWTIF